MAWIIYNINDPELCWNNQDGWQSDNYDTFTDEEREELNLPFDGAWERVPWSKDESE